MYAGSFHAVLDQVLPAPSTRTLAMGISKRWGAWETLFQDHDDGRYWERTYPNSEMHEGGPPALVCVSEEEAKAKYGDEILPKQKKAAVSVFYCRAKTIF
jgi:hypothetical protein